MTITPSLYDKDSVSCNPHPLKLKIKPTASKKKGRERVCLI